MKNLLRTKLVVVAIVIAIVIVASWAFSHKAEAAEIPVNSTLEGYKVWLNPSLKAEESTAAAGWDAGRALRATIMVFGQTVKENGEKGGSSGSGVIIDNLNCLAVTNAHVTENMVFLNVTYATGHRADGSVIERATTAEIIGHPSDKGQYDLSLIRLDSCEGTTWAPLGNSDALRHDAPVWAFGHPMGIRWTLTRGVVSNPHQNRDDSPWPWVQTDACINPGNSGGPLFNERGEVIGINSEIISKASQCAGIGFSRPANLVKLYLRNLHFYGHMATPRIGMVVSNITETAARALDMGKAFRARFGREFEGYYGVLVGGVNNGSPGEEAGLQENDVLISFNGIPLYNTFQLIQEVSKTLPGVLTPLSYLRNGQVYVTNVSTRDAWQPPEPRPQAEAYEGLMGWTLEINPEKFQDNGTPVDLPVITGRAFLSPIFKSGAAEAVEGRESTANAGMPPLEIARFFSPEDFTVFTRETSFVAIESVKAEGLAELELGNLPVSKRIAALRHYIGKAHAARKPVMLWLRAVKREERRMPALDPETIRSKPLSEEARDWLLAMVERATTPSIQSQRVPMAIHPAPYRADRGLPSWEH